MLPSTSWNVTTATTFVVCELGGSHCPLRIVHVATEAAGAAAAAASALRANSTQASQWRCKPGPWHDTSAPTTTGERSGVAS
jgi:hypothetical protein